ncbi:MAG: hypothetical protein OSB44_02995 [Verrucomicrobiales bacterium]|nr:hypothetical protein [Verrucomicrobiales bacterium]
MWCLCGVGGYVYGYSMKTLYIDLLAFLFSGRPGRGDRCITKVRRDTATPASFLTGAWRSSSRRTARASWAL